MGGFSTFLCEAVWNHLRGGAAWTQPAGLRLAASTADPGASGSGLSEPTDAAYARVNVDSSFPVVVGRNLASDTNAVFAAATAIWGWITHVALYDDLGNFLLPFTLAEAKYIGTGDVLTLDATDLVFNLPWE